jgi:hypothetical protein
VAVAAVAETVAAVAEMPDAAARRLKAVASDV